MDQARDQGKANVMLSSVATTVVLQNSVYVTRLRAWRLTWWRMRLCCDWESCWVVCGFGGGGGDVANLALPKLDVSVKGTETIPPPGRAICTQGYCCCCCCCWGLEPYRWWWWWLPSEAPSLKMLSSTWNRFFISVCQEQLKGSR